MTEKKEDYTSKFQIQHNRDDSTGVCIRKYENYTAKNKQSPAKQILEDPNKITQVFQVPASNGEMFNLSLAWIIGFLDGEGTFAFYLNKNKELTLGFQIQAAFVIVQGEADYYLLTAIANFFGCGTVAVNHADKTSVRYQYRVVDPKALTELFIPLFKAYPPCTKKGLEFATWSTWVEFLKDKKQLENWPNNMIMLLEGLKAFKLLGASTKQAVSFVHNCDSYIQLVKTLPSPKRKV
jgi:hypothetical protein